MSIDYRGERFRDFNVPKRTPSHPTKSHAVLAKVGNVVKLIRFGQQGVKGSPKRAGESERERKRREAFKARHAQSIAKGKLGAAWWADRVKWGTNPMESRMQYFEIHPMWKGRAKGYPKIHRYYLVADSPRTAHAMASEHFGAARFEVTRLHEAPSGAGWRELEVDTPTWNRIVKNPGDIHIDIESHNRSPGYRENAGAKMRVTIDSWIKALSFFERYRRGSEAKLGHNTFVRTRSTGVPGSADVEIVLHSTPIVTYHADGTVTLNSGGWQTATTKARMNELLPSHLQIVQEKGKWFVREYGAVGRMGQRLAFFDGMRIGYK